MLECKKIIIEKEEKHSLNLESISIVVVEKIPEESDIKFIVSESKKNNCSFIMIWSPLAQDIENNIDSYLEFDGFYDVITTSHENESEFDVANFAKNATFVGNSSFHCLIFSEFYSIKAKKLIENLSV